MKRSIIILVMSLSLSFSSLSFAQEAESLTYMTEEYAPFCYSENDVAKGIYIDILKKMWSKMEVAEQPIIVYPWARGYNLVQKKKNHVLFGMSRTEEREQLFKWVGPIYTTEFSLIGLTSSKIKISSIEEAKKLLIGTIREDVTEQRLKAAGFPEKNLEGVVSLEQNVKKLKTGRINVIAYAEKSFNDYINSAGYDSKDFEKVFPLETLEVYFAFNKHTPDTLILQFQEALNSIEEERMEIIDRYLN